MSGLPRAARGSRALALPVLLALLAGLVGSARRLELGEAAAGSPRAAELAAAERTIVYAVTPASGPRFRLAGGAETVLLVTHLRLPDADYVPGRVYRFGVVATLRGADGEVVRQWTVSKRTRQTKAVPTAEGWAYEAAFVPDGRLQLSDGGSVELELPGCEPDSTLEIRLSEEAGLLASGGDALVARFESPTAMVRVYRRISVDPDELELRRLKVARDAGARRLAAATYLPWYALSPEQQRRRLAGAWERMAAEGHTGADYRVHSIYVAPARPPEVLAPPEPAIEIGAGQPALVHLRGPGQVTVRARVVDRSPAGAPELELRARRLATLDVPALATDTRAPLDSRWRDIPLALEAGWTSLELHTGEPRVLLQVLADAPETHAGPDVHDRHRGPDGRPFVPVDLQTLSTYRAGPDAAPLTVRLAGPDDVYARVLRIDARAPGPPGPIPVRVEFVDAGGRLLAGVDEVLRPDAPAPFDRLRRGPPVLLGPWPHEHPAPAGPDPRAETGPSGHVHGDTHLRAPPGPGEPDASAAGPDPRAGTGPSGHVHGDTHLRAPPGPGEPDASAAGPDPRAGTGPSGHVPGDTHLRAPPGPGELDASGDIAGPDRAAAAASSPRDPAGGPDPPPDRPGGAPPPAGREGPDAALRFALADGPVSAPATLRLIAPPGATAARISAEAPALLELHGLLPPPERGDDVSPWAWPYSQIDAPGERWRHAPRRRSRWFPLRADEHAALAAAGEVVRIQAQVRREAAAEPVQARGPWRAEHPRGRHTRVFLLERAGARRGPEDRAAWGAGTYTALRRGVTEEIELGRGGARPTRVLVQGTGKTAAVLGASVALRVGEQALRWRLLGRASRRTLDLPPRGRAALTWTEGPDAALVLVDRPSSSGAPVYRRRQLHQLAAGPLRLVVDKPGPAATAINVVVYWLDGTPRAPTLLRVRLDGGAPGRRAGAPLARISAAEQTIAAIPEERVDVLFPDGRGAARVGVARLSIPLGDDIGPGRHTLELVREDGPPVWLRFFRHGKPRPRAGSWQWNERRDGVRLEDGDDEDQ